MRRDTMLTRCAVLLIAVLTPSLAFAQPKVLIALEHAGPDAILGDPRDAPLRQMLDRTPDLLAPLRQLGEANGFGVGFGAEGDALLALFAEMNHKPRRLAIVHDPSVVSGGGLGYGLLSQVDAGPGAVGQVAAWALDQRVRQVIAGTEMTQQPIPSTRYPGQTELWFPFVRVVFGPRQVGEEWVYEIFVGAIDSPDATLDALGWTPLEDGAVPLMRLQANPAALDPALTLIGGFIAMQPEAQRDQVVKTLGVLRGLRLLGPDALGFELNIASHEHDGAGELVTSVGVRNAVWVRDLLNQSPDPLDPRTLGTVPLRASGVAALKFDPAAINGLLGLLDRQNIPLRIGLLEVEAALEVSLDEDLLPALGDEAVAFVVGDGENRPRSAALIVELDDPARFAQLHDGLLAKYGGMIGATRDERGIVSFGGADAGMPFSPAWGVVDRWLVVGATVDGYAAARAQILGRAAGFEVTPVGRAALDQGDAQVVYIDTPRAIPQGYDALVSLLGLNADGEAGPGVMPDRDTLAAGAHPLVHAARWAGDRFIMTLRGDRSFLANAAALLGAIGSLDRVIADLFREQPAAEHIDDI